MNYIAVQNQALTIKNLILACLFDDAFKILKRFTHETKSVEKYEDEIEILEAYHQEQSQKANDELENDYLIKNLLITLKDILQDSLQGITPNSNAYLTEIIDECNLLITDYQKNTKFHRHTARTWYIAGETWQKMGQYEPAIDAFQRSVKIDKKNFLAWNNLSMLYRKQKQYEKSIEASLKSIEIIPRDYMWGSIAVTYEVLQRPEKALESYLNALSLNDKSYMTWYSLGRVYQTLKQIPKAIEAYENVIKLNPQKEQAWVNLGVLYIEADDYQKSIEINEKIIHFQPDNAVVWFYLGFAYDELERYDEAIISYQKSLELEDDPEVWCNLGITYTAQENYEKAIQMLEKTSQMIPENDEVWIHLATVYFFAKKYDDAQKCCEKLFEISPESKWANYIKANLLLQKGHLEEAEKQLLHYPLEDEPSYLLYLGHIALCKGKESEARKLYSQSLELCESKRRLHELFREMKHNAEVLQAHYVPTAFYQQIIEEIKAEFVTKITKK